MGRSDQHQVERFDQRQRVEHKLAERPHDMRVVILERKAEIADAVVEQSRVAEMTTEDVTGKQDAVLHQIGALRVRPVQVGRVQKTQRAAAEFHSVVGGDRCVFRRFLETRLEQCLEHHLRPARQVDAGLRRAAQQFGQRTAVVRLQMIEDDGRDFGVVGD